MIVESCSLELYNDQHQLIDSVFFLNQQAFQKNVKILKEALLNGESFYFPEDAIDDSVALSLENVAFVKRGETSLPLDSIMSTSLSGLNLI